MEKPSAIAEKIRKIRKNCKLSQRRFGAKLGVSGKTISAYEQGRCDPPLSILENISKTFNVPILHLREDKKSELEHKMCVIKEILLEIEDVVGSGLSL